ncbi:Metallo-peptidase family M12-domain-containing protein [Podospora appendiculata]|uniref:Disintegrin and metalloproteinase domain-containing protein B n=1 Tax=Podospora appendiculata TaxID=314037 RepID=A0AAE0X326_9PEZI|nr:Metallo-peptidase family M12-domain-containing protein [Podospora appendiculata]
MIIPRALAAVVAGVVLLVQSATAHSVQRNPLTYVSRIDDAVIQTPSHRVHALSSFDISFFLHDRGQKIRLTLEPNHDILSEDATVQILGPDGKVIRVEPIDRLDHKIFKGTAFIRLDGHTEWTNAGWARINVHQDGPKPIFEGAFKVDGDHHHIQTSKNYKMTSIPGDPEIEEADEEYMIVWRDSDLVGAVQGQGHQDEKEELKRSLASTGCSADELLYNRDETNLVYRGVDDAEGTTPWAQINPMHLFGRQIDGTAGGNGAGVNLADTIGSTAGCPTTRKVALVGIATDCTYTKLLGSEEAARKNIIQQVNSASQLYEGTFNISLGIQNLTISASDCPSTASADAPWNVGCSSSVTITNRLNLFSAWRGKQTDANAYWTLLTTCNTGAAVGLAWLGQVCQAGSQISGDETIAAANVVVRTSTEWLVFAHETGHTFGAVHDCTPQTCGDGSVTKQQCCPLSGSSCDAGADFIMNPSTASGITNFSPCSIGNVCSFLGRNSARVGCLANNKDVSTITPQQCGNGIVEPGEDCDCGGASGCGNNPCCDATTCKFKPNSVCDPSNEECCSGTCKFLSQGTVCRPSTGSCDPAETCSGTSPVCPTDATSPDGTSCGGSNAGLTCASGQCTSRDLQCKTLMGSLTKGNDTYSCSSQGCVLSCASPEFGQNVCYSMQQYFLDGTTCEGGGKCSNGNCIGANLTNQIGDWVKQNLNIVIPVAVVVGLLIIAAFASCCWNSWRSRRRPAPASRIPKPPNMGQQYGGGWSNHPYGPAGMPMRPPPGPGPVRGGYNGAPMPDARYEPVRTGTFRYA